MEKLYSRGDAASHGYRCHADSISVIIEGCEPQEIEIGKMLIGTVECFLDQVVPTRICDLFAPQDSIFEAVPYYQIKEDIFDFKSGFMCNRFLSHMLDVSNQCLIERSKKLSEIQGDYQLRAMVYSRIVRELSDLWRLTGALELYALSSKHRETALFYDGDSLERSHTIAKIKISATPMKRFVQEFKKDEFICRAGDRSDSLFVLLRGKVGVQRGGRNIAYVTEVGEAFGEISLFLNGIRTASLIAETSTALYRIKKRDLPEFFAKHQDMFLNIARTIAERIDINIRKIMHINKRLQEFEKSDLSADPEFNYRKEPDSGKTEIIELLEDLEQLRTCLRLPNLNKFCAQLKKDREIKRALN